LNPLTTNRLRLITMSRQAGDRVFDPSTRRCLIARDTIWYAISLLFDTSQQRREEGLQLLASTNAEDATHTPATMLALLHRIPDLLSHDARMHLETEIRGKLEEAADCVWIDGNVNHPLAAYASLILGGEYFAKPWAMHLGLRRLVVFRQRIGDHRSRFRRQAEMSEYNSPTYTALTLWWLALLAEHAETADAQRLARFLEERLWVDIAMHFHAPSQQFAGPHSRSYMEDSMGGFSALHCTMLAALDDPLFLDPELPVRYNHPSALLQNSLAAILPYHVPDLARQLFWQKPFPYTFRKTTYAERYHENSRIAVYTGGTDLLGQMHGAGESSPSGSTAPDTSFAFDDEAYHGGWAELTTFMTEEFALGSASLPYVNAGHADAVMLRIRRNARIAGTKDFRSMFTRGVYNGARIGQRNFCHVTQSEIDESYLYEEGRSATYQRDNRIIVCYAPKRAGHLGVTGFRLDIIFTYPMPFDALLVNGEEVARFPHHCPPDSRICFRDFQTFGLILLAPPVPSSPDPVLLWRNGDFLILSLTNYEGPAGGFSRHDINGWRTGFAMELATSSQTMWEEFLHRASSASLSDVLQGQVRNLTYSSGENVMQCSYDPYREELLSRKWNGAWDGTDHFSVRAGEETTGPWCPATLFGKEIMK
jgi:hypothetical protein